MSFTGVYPLVDGLVADHVISFNGKATAYLFGTVQFLNDKAAHLRLHFFGKPYGLWLLLHALLVLALGKIVVILVMTAAIAVPL